MTANCLRLCWHVLIAACRRRLPFSLPMAPGGILLFFHIRFNVWQLKARLTAAEMERWKCKRVRFEQRKKERKKRQGQKWNKRNINTRAELFQKPTEVESCCFLSVHTCIIFGWRRGHSFVIQVNSHVLWLQFQWHCTIVTLQLFIRKINPASFHSHKLLMLILSKSISVTATARGLFHSMGEINHSVNVWAVHLTHSCCVSVLLKQQISLLELFVNSPDLTVTADLTHTKVPRVRDYSLSKVKPSVKHNVMVSVWPLSTISSVVKCYLNYSISIEGNC